MSKKGNSIARVILKFLLLVAAITFIIVTLGWFIRITSSSTDYVKPIEDDIKKKDGEDVKGDLLEKEKKQKQIDLKNCEERIILIEETKVSIFKREKYVFMAARGLIGICLITLNVLYLWHKQWIFSLDKQLNFNGSVLLCYSFLAFITYGTPSRFVNALKTKISYFLKRKHIELFEELDPLKIKVTKLQAEIKEIELKQIQAKETERLIKDLETKMN